MRTTASDISDIKKRLEIMDEQFARKEDLNKTQGDIVILRTNVQELEVKLAVAKSELRTWGIIGGFVVTIIAAIISAIEIHL